MYEVLYEHNLYGLFEPPGFPTRYVEGRRLVTYTAAGEDRVADLFACNDGTHYCECQAHIDEGKRPLMRQEPGHFGVGGEVYVTCDNHLERCPHAGHPLYVPFRMPDRLLAKGRREAGEVDYTRVNPLWRGDEKVAAMNFLGRQVIEGYHQGRFEMFGLGSKDRRTGRRFLGDDAHQFWHTAGDLLWNETVIEAYERLGVRPEVVEASDVCKAMLANGRQVAKLKAIKRAAAARRAEAARQKRSRSHRHKAPPPAVGRLAQAA